MYVIGSPPSEDQTTLTQHPAPPRFSPWLLPGAPEGSSVRCSPARIQTPDSQPGSRRGHPQRGLRAGARGQAGGTEQRARAVEPLEGVPPPGRWPGTVGSQCLLFGSLKRWAEASSSASTSLCPGGSSWNLGCWSRAQPFVPVLPLPAPPMHTHPVCPGKFSTRRATAASFL